MDQRLMFDGILSMQSPITPIAHQYKLHYALANPGSTIRVLSAFATLSLQSQTAYFSSNQSLLSARRYCFLLFSHWTTGYKVHVFLCLQRWTAQLGRRTASCPVRVRWTSGPTGRPAPDPATRDSRTSPATPPGPAGCGSRHSGAEWDARQTRRPRGVPSRICRCVKGQLWTCAPHAVRTRSAQNAPVDTSVLLE